jgi:hypothetical protein
MTLDAAIDSRLTDRVRRAVGLGVGSPVDVAFGPGGGSVPLRFTLTAPPPAPDPDGDSRLRVDLDLVELTITPLDHEATVAVPGATGTALGTDLGADREVRRVRVFDLVLPRSGTTLFRFDQGGVLVQTPRAAGDPENPAFTAVHAVLSAGAAGGPAPLPARGFPGIGPPDAAGLYGDQLPGGRTNGAPAQFTLDCLTPVRATRLELRFCTGDSPLELGPVAFTARAEVVHAAPPRGLRLTVGPPAAPVLAWQHDPPLSRPDTVGLVPVLGTLLDEAAGAGGSLTVDAELSCAAEARIRLLLTTRGSGRSRVRHRAAPARVPLAGAGAELPAGVVGDPEPDTVTARLTGSAGPVRRTAGSPSPLADPARTGTVVGDGRQVARHVDAAALEGRPLVRVGVLAAGVAGELVVELRADAGGPGPVLAPGGVAALPTVATPGWRTVEIPPLDPVAVPPAGCWIVLRASAGRLLWADGGPPGPVMVSDDGGGSWHPATGTAPALALFVDDPGGAVPALTARVGAETGTLLAAPAAAFDAVLSWPVALRRAFPTAPVARLDCARDLQLEVAELTAGWTAALALRSAP